MMWSKTLIWIMGTQ